MEKMLLAGAILIYDVMYTWPIYNPAHACLRVVEKKKVTESELQGSKVS